CARQYCSGFYCYVDGDFIDFW
nr:immunoglobulin heavy chain junction region [Macaca mulatta]MOY18505.1 immunoglobulin heavy chain junction region [Macaca mulatta]MOY18852.1 immunoglobulin heavy chain junction region [Macaca mulatta]MOY18855.1 immunoglobulin heavy chain junction region [Macaca mulatta]MOY19153.1 immunoglobulin heavy chain junction region [Macaca mulatta]